MIVHDHATIAIQNLTARRKHGNGLDAVLLRALLIHLRISNLQIPEAGDEKQKYGDGSVLKKRDLLRGELGVVAQKCVGSFDRLRGRREVSQCSALAGHFQFIQNTEQRQGYGGIQ